MNGKLVIAFLAGLVLSANAMAQWVHLPAGEPYVNSLSVDSSGQHMLLSTEGSGLWRSMNGGGSWEPYSTHVRPQGTVSITSQYMLDAGGDTVLCTGYADGGYWNGYTLDGGLTWTRFSDERIQSYGNFEVWNHGHNVWFFGSDQNLLRSTDYGQTWTAMSYVPLATGIHQDREQDSTLYVTSSYDHANIINECGLRRSTDLGLTWEPMMDENSLPDTNWVMLYGLLRLSNGDLIVTGWFENPGGVVISEDNGLTWNPPETFLGDVYPTSRPNHVIMEDAEFPGRLFLAAGNVSCGVQRSDDFGRNWHPCNGGLPAYDSFASEIFQDSVSGYIYAHVAYHGMYFSTDHGDTWQPVNLPPVGTSGGSIHVFPDAVCLHQESESYPYRQWELMQPYTEWHELNTRFEPGDPAVVIGPILIHMWPIRMACANIYSWVDTVHSVVAYNFGDSDSWFYGDAIPYDIQVSSAISQPWNGHFHLMAITQDYHSVMKSDDDGDHWSLAYTMPTDGFVEAIAQNHSILALSYDDWSTSDFTHSVCYSSDYGANWTCLLAPDPAVFRSLTLIGPELYGISGGNCVHLQDSAWEIRGAVPASDGMTAVLDADTLLVIPASTPGTLWISEDLGWTWQARSYALPYAEQNIWLGSLAYDVYRHRLWGMAGVGVCYLDASELSTDGPLTFKPADYTLLSVYPNPFNAETKIRFDLLKREQVTVKLYDVLGREVRTVVDGMQEAGRHEIALSMPDAASGIYFVRVKTAEVEKTMKVALLR